MGEILSNLLSIKPEEGFSFKSKSSWTFPDGYKIKRGVNSPIVVLYYKQNPIGVLSFTHSYLNKEIKINFIQGVKQVDPTINLNKFNKNWYEYILDSFITASLPLLSKGKNIYFNPIVEEKSFMLSSIKTREILILYNKSRIENFENKIKALTKLPTPKNLEYIRAYQNNIYDLKKENAYYEKVITTMTSILRINGTIQDKYFNKEGRLNIQKERVKKIITNYENSIKRSKTVSTIFKIKRRIKPR